MRTLSTFLVLAIAGAAVVACDVFYEPEDTRGKPKDGINTPEQELSTAVTEGGLRVLTQREYERSIHDLFGAEISIPPLSHGATLEGWTTVGASQSSIASKASDDLEAAALEIAKQAFAESKREKLTGCVPTDAPADACVKSFVEKWGRRVFRRSLTGDEESQYVKLAEETSKDLGSAWGGLEMALAGMLESPNFVYRVDAVEADPTASGMTRFTSYSMASRLSYFLWASTPDDELLDAAEKGELGTEAGVRKAAERMMGNEKAASGVAAFLDDFLDIPAIGRMEKNVPEATPQLKAALQEQVARTAKDILWDRGASYLELFTTRDIFMSPELASLYGVTAPQASGFAKMTFDDASGRSGLLTWAGILALRGRGIEASPMGRGMFVRQRLLCQTVNPPPPGVSTMQPTEMNGVKLSERQLAEARMANPQCGGCHKPMDGVGLGLENFDGLGRYRTKIGNEDVDATGNLDGVAFSNAKELTNALRNHPQIPICGARNLMRYATGRMESAAEEPLVQGLVTKFVGVDQKIKTMFGALVVTDAFRRPFVGRVVESGETK